MAYDQFPTLGRGLSGPVTPGASLVPKPRLLVAQFGDGYAQRTADGINALPSNFMYKSAAIPHANAKILDDFLRTKKGYIPFLFMVPGEAVMRQFTCSVWSLDFAYGLHSTLTATFEENYDP